MKNRFSLVGGIALAVLLSLSAISFAQERQPAPERVMIDKIEHERIILEHGRPGMPHGGDFVFLASEMSFGGKLVKGAPYSAEAVTESTQTLSDGNRIVNKSTASVYRDSEGRTRREQTLRAIGPFATGGAPPQTIYISDPVAGVSYVLEPHTQIARKMPPMRFKFEHKVPPSEEWTAAAPHAAHRIDIESGPVMSKKATEAGVAIGLLHKQNPNTRTESLGRQDIGGVEADGTKSTVIIATGEIGNERPIETVSERWYSPELQTVVMTRHIDPRFGETSYRLTNINRTEPARVLFEVPAGYTVEEGPPPQPGHRVRLRKPALEQ